MAERETALGGTTAASAPVKEQSASPVGATKRVTAVDAIRALALFGVVAINMQTISGLTYLSPDVLEGVQSGLHDAVQALLDILVKKKALSTFSFLFGLSFTLLLNSSLRAGRPFKALYLRRLFFLGCFGLLNATFFFWGDILTTYAVFGLLLLVALRMSQGTVLVFAGILTLAVPFAMAAFGSLRGPGIQLATDVEALLAFGEVSVWSTIKQNIERFFAAVQGQSALGPWNYSNILGLFLLGLWAGRARVLQDIDGHKRLLKRTAWVAVPLGVGMSLLEWALPYTHPLATAMLASTPVLAVGYIATAAILLNGEKAHGIRDFLAPAGKLALTFYMLSGLLGAIVFYGWGFGLLARVGAGTVLLISVAIYLLLLLASRVWLTWFRYGPFEWAWRCLTYMGWQPIRR